MLLPASAVDVADLYARKSSSDQGRSVARQKRRWLADCLDLGVQPGRVFVDPNFSASRYGRKERPDYAELLDHIRSRHCKMISLWEVTRADRQMGPWVAFLDLCRDLGVFIRIFGDEDPATYDPRRWRDREFLLKEGVAAEGEIEKLRARVREGIDDAAHQGRPPGPLLYGYARVYGAPTSDSVTASGHKRRTVKQVINEDEARIVRRLAADTLAGIPLQRQAILLNDAGVPTPSGEGRWTGGHINRMLRNPGYEGHRIHRDKLATTGAWPAILDSETASQLRAMLEQPGRLNHADASLAYQLSGAALCGVCRRPLRPKKANGRHRYQCLHRGCMAVSAGVREMDEVVDEFIRARLRMPDAAAAFTPITGGPGLDQARAELAALKKRLAELEDAASQPDGEGLDFLMAAARKLRPQIEAADARVRQLQTPATLRGYDPHDLADRWPDYPVGERRLVIMTLAEVVLSQVGKAGRWSYQRLAESQWRGDSQTWGDIWRREGVVL
ncbi:recombinase family protein [Micromonospora sp. NPDC049801]|uniref:recombinase family protein n=1 Tax=unclassified Micromonospora TaxID=2617518 RepID=UPI0033E978C3